MSKVVVLGCGPSGLIAAKAVEDAGHEPVIKALKRKSVMPGAIFVHKHIPGLTSDQPDAKVLFLKLGHRGGYATKVYGSSTAACSWDIFPEGFRDAWDVVKVYHDLWDKYGHTVEDVAVQGGDVEDMMRRNIVVSTIPAPAICGGDHTFYQKDIWIREGHFPVLDQSIRDPVIVYDGMPEHAWYRASSLFGNLSMEFGHWVSNSVAGIKPLSSTCDCHPDLIRAGRFGTWEKGVLITDAYRTVKEALS